MDFWIVGKETRFFTRSPLIFFRVNYSIVEANDE